MKKIIVTGAGGFIGSAMTKYALERGIIVYGVDVSEKLLEKHGKYKNFIPVIADFTQYHRLHEKILDPDIDVFYHFAWQGVFGESFQDYHLQLDNAAFAADALNEAVAIQCRKFVFSGTYNEIEIGNFIDWHRAKPRYTCIYSAVKSAAEIICKTLAYNKGIAYSAGLSAMSYGENNRSMMVTNVVLKQLVNGESPKLIEGNIPYDFVYIDDIVRAFYAIGEKGKNLRSYYIGHRTLRTFREWLETIGQIVAPDVPLLFGAFPDDASARDFDSIDLDALYQDTGFACKADVRESFLKTAAWVKENL